MEIREIIKQAGGAKCIADRLGISPAAVYAWHDVPAERVVVIAEMSGLRPSDIRPDVFYGSMK